MKKKRGPVVYTKLQQGETMKSIEGFSHYYITNFGRVLSTRPLGRKGNTPSELREITLSFGNGRYYYCNIYDDNGKRHSKRVNRMVYGYHNPYNDELKQNLVVDHKDDNKKNNNISNLMQITYAENSQKYHQSKRL
jgi:hypothetical protein